jgi:hypothetical protein
MVRTIVREDNFLIAVNEHYF